MPVRSATAVWNGTLKEGNGQMNGQSGAFDTPFTWATRFSDTPGTNPEELIGAALAGCFSMFLGAQLEKAGFPATRVSTTAHVTLESGTISPIELVTEVVAPGIDQATFDEKVAFSKENCPVSKALAAANVAVTATLAQG